MSQCRGVRLFAGVLFSLCIGVPAWADSVTFNRLKLAAQGYMDDYATDSANAVSSWGGALGIEYVAQLMSAFALELAAGQRRDRVTSADEQYGLVETYYAYGGRGLWHFAGDEMAMSLAGRAFGGRLSSQDLLLMGTNQDVGYRWAEIGFHHFYVAPWSEAGVTLRRYFWSDDTYANAVTAEFISGSYRLMWGIEGETTLDLQHIRLGASLNYAF
ncbi:hypothetical protein ACFOSD_02695 [Salinispirillum marinum]|uniref:DUF481 domain-containing protein n=2 Tax=Saccharospirillaceae TaxID=255527 RepID=A0ABV8BA96_9GAMM